MASCGVASWLFAAPATVRQRSSGIVSRLSTLPVAPGAKTSHSVPITSSARTTFAPSSSASVCGPLRVDVGEEEASRRHHGDGRRGGSPPSQGPCTSTDRPSRRIVPERSAGRSRGSRGRHQGRWRHRGPPTRRSRSKPAENVRRPLPERVHVGLAGVHVGRGHVGAMERLDQLRVAEEGSTTLLAPACRDRRDGDHRLSTSRTEVRPRPASKSWLRRAAGRRRERRRDQRTRVSLVPPIAGPRVVSWIPISIHEEVGSSRWTTASSAVPGFDQLLERHESDSIGGRPEQARGRRAAGAASARPPLTRLSPDQENDVHPTCLDALAEVKKKSQPPSGALLLFASFHSPGDTDDLPPRLQRPWLPPSP